MFKKLIQTGVSLTRTGIDTLQKVATSVIDHSQPEQAQDAAEAKPPSTKTINDLKANLMRQATFKHGKTLLEKNTKPAFSPQFRVPDLKFTAVGSGKEIELRKLYQPAVLFISHRETAKQAAELNWQLVKPYLGRNLPYFTGILILLNEFPSLLHPMVKRELRKAYQDIAKDYFHDEQLAAKIVHLLPDWQAAALKGFPIAQRRPVLAAVILTPYGNIQRVIESENPLPLIEHELVMLTK